MEIDDRDSTIQTTLDKNQSSTGIDDKRRNLAKAGLTAPVLMTLISRPAFAKQCSPSVMASGNLSDPGDASTCGTCNHVQWLNTKLSNYQDCGIMDPHAVNIDSICNIRMIRGGSEPAVIGNLPDALAGTCVVSRSLKYRDRQARVNIDPLIGEPVLLELLSFACTVYLNALNPWTSMNINYDLALVIPQVDDALRLFNRKRTKMDFNKLVNMRDACSALMSDGSSCALT